MDTLYPRLCICSAYLPERLSAQCYVGVVLSLPPLPSWPKSTINRVLRAGRDQPRTELIGTAELDVPAVEIARSGYIAYLG